MVNGQKVLAAVSAAIESRAYFKQSIAEYLEKEFGKEDWYAPIAALSSKTNIDLPSITDDYYKKKDSISVKLVVDDSVKELFGKNTNNQIYKRLFKECEGLDRIKASYVKSNNNNFAVLLREETEMGISAISKSEFQYKVGLILELLRWEMMSRTHGQKILDITKSVSSAYGSIELRSIINMIYSSLRSIASAKLPDYRYRSHYDTVSRSIATGNTPSRSIQLKLIDDFILEMKPSKAALNIIVKAIALSVAKTKSSDLLSLSSFVNNTLDYPSKIAENLNSNSFPVKYEWTNPVSGFVSIKTKREQLEESKLSKEEFDKLVETHREINRIYEKSVSLISEYKIKKKLDKETVVKLVSGEEIISLYEITSYYNYNKASDNGSGGSLYNSCMRHIGYKQRISAYANNPHMVKMLAVVTKATNKLKARAVVWYDEEKDIHYVDRIFYYDQESKNQMKVFINENKNFISIYSGNEIDRSQSSFLIPFKYAIPSADGPFLDSIRHNIIIDNNGNRFIGIPSSSEYTETQVRWYMTGFINENANIARNKCVCCSSMTDNKLGNTYACRRHVRIDGSRKPFLASGSKIIYPYGIKKENVGDEGEKYVRNYSSTKENFIRPQKTLNSLSTLNSDGSKVRVVSGAISNGSSYQRFVYSRISSKNGEDIFDRSGTTYEAFYDDTMVPVNISSNIVFLAVKDENDPAFSDSIKALAATIEFASIGEQQLTALKNVNLDEIMKEGFIRNYTKKEWDSRIGKVNIANPIAQISSSAYGNSDSDFIRVEFIDENDNSKSINDIGIISYLTIPGSRLSNITIPISVIGGDINLATKMVNDAKKGN